MSAQSPNNDETTLLEELESQEHAAAEPLSPDAVEIEGRRIRLDDLEQSPLSEAEHIVIQLSCRREARTRWGRWFRRLIGRESAVVARIRSTVERGGSESPLDWTLAAPLEPSRLDDLPEATIERGEVSWLSAAALIALLTTLRRAGAGLAHHTPGADDEVARSLAPEPPPPVPLHQRPVAGNLALVGFGLAISLAIAFIVAVLTWWTSPVAGWIVFAVVFLPLAIAIGYVDLPYPFPDYPGVARRSAAGFLFLVIAAGPGWITMGYGADTVVGYMLSGFDDARGTPENLPPDAFIYDVEDAIVAPDWRAWTSETSQGSEHSYTDRITVAPIVTEGTALEAGVTVHAWAVCRDHDYYATVTRFYDDMATCIAAWSTATGGGVRPRPGYEALIDEAIVNARTKHGLRTTDDAARIVWMDTPRAYLLSEIAVAMAILLGGWLLWAAVPLWNAWRKRSSV